MIQITTEQIEAQLEKLPQDLRDAVSSNEIRNTIQEVGKKHNLLIDQLGEMIDLVGLIMLGLSPAKDFVKNFTRESGVNSDIASAIAKDINNEVFSKLRLLIQSMPEKSNSEVPLPSKNMIGNQNNNDLSALERTGGFTIEKESTSDTPDFIGKEVTEADKDNILSGIEDTNPIPETDSEQIEEKMTETYTEPLVDRLLSGATARSEEKIIHKQEPVAPSNLPTKEINNKIAMEPTVPKKPSGPDSYREPIE